MQTESPDKAKQAFLLYLQEIAVKYLTVKLLLAILVLIYFAYSDLTILHSTGNFYSRLLPLSTAIPLLVFHLLTKQRFKYLKTILINVFVTSLLTSMYIICIVHLYENTLAPAVTATLFVIFIVSLEIKTNTISTVLIYFIPTLILVLVLFFFYPISGEQHLILSNIYMFIILSFALNRVQYALRFTAFNSNYLLKLEKQKTEKHYEVALKMNAELSKSHKEITLQRDEIEQKNIELHNKNVEIISQAKEIEYANQKLQQLNLFKEEMTSMIVHDLKNPLNSIIGLAESDVIKQSGKQMLNMVMNILDVQKYENTKIVLDPLRSDTSKIAESAIQQIDLLLKQKSIHLHNNIQNYFIIVEWELIERVFVNILTNAVKFTPNNGKITINTSLIPAENGDTTKNILQVTISDTGQGIPADSIDAVFQKFEQVVAKKSGLTRSTGIGLTYCKLIIEAHGGKIGVKSEPEKGTSFWFTLPADLNNNEGSDIRRGNPDMFEIELSDSEKSMLNPLLSKFGQFEIFEFSSLEKILRDPVFSKSKNLKKWKGEMNNALLGSNYEKFTMLLDMISEPKQ